MLDADVGAGVPLRDVVVVHGVVAETAVDNGPFLVTVMDIQPRSHHFHLTVITQLSDNSHTIIKQ